MKILQLCNKPPYPPLEGGAIAMNSITQGLINQGHQVKVIAVNTYKYHVTPDQIPEDYKKNTHLELVDIDLRIKPLKAFLNLFSGKSYHVERFISEDFKQKLINTLQTQEFDIVQIETIFLMPYVPLIRSLSKASIVLRAHNIEHQIWQRLYRNCTSPVKKLYLKHLANTLQHFELDAINSADGIITISKPDLDFFQRSGCKVPMTVISFGLNKELINSIHPQSPSVPDSVLNIGYIGSMNWIPNIEGMKWFFEKVWDPNFRLNTKLHFHLAGRNIPEDFKDYAFSNVTIHGEVPDANAFIDDMDMIVVPLFSGSGIRIKIIESMLHKKPVISTTIGAEGINCSDRHDIVIADTVQEFIDAIALLSENSDLRNIIGNNAYELIHLEHNQDLITPQLIEFYQSLSGHE